ncbi:MAG: hypothetical protein GY799_32780 [Desulfobulbaceae bacterium]|nr:hypothetical protein [Desulfobulbaceae bacterium]
MKISFFFSQFVYFTGITLWMSVMPALAGAAGEPTLSPARPDEWFIYAIILFGILGTLLSMLLIRSALMNEAWSLAEALSEQVELTEPAPTGDTESASGNAQPADNQPVVQVKKLYPSSSRMVALIGTIAILFLFLSFGAFALFHFAQTGQMPEGIDKAVTFLTAGLTLFAPYVVNKFSKSFEILSPKR